MIYVTIRHGSSTLFAGVCDGGLRIQCDEKGENPELSLHIWDNSLQALGRYTPIRGGEPIKLQLEATR